MRDGSVFRPIGRVKSRLALGWALFFCAATGVQAQSTPSYYWANDCKLIQIGETGHGGATQWVKTGLDTGTVGNVIAFRTLTLIFSGAIKLKARAGDNPKLMQGARWTRTPAIANHLIPTNVEGLAIQISSGGKPGVFVTPRPLDYFLTTYSVNSLATGISSSNHFGGVIVVELVVTGDVPAGSHVVSDIDPTWVGTKFEVVATQRTANNAPALGTVIESNFSDGTNPSLGAKCYDRKTYTVMDILTVGGGGVPIEKKCTVDAKFTGAGFSLPMGSYSSSDFPSNGSVGKEVPFEISVHTCGAGSKPKIAFNAQYGLISTAIGSVLQLKDHTAAGSAKNLGVILTRQGDSSSKSLNIGQGGSVGKKYDFDDVPAAGVTENGGVEIKLGARYLRVDQSQPGVTGGAADSQVNFKIYYD